MIKVGINGYGTIGKRVAYAVSLQRDMTVTGIVKSSPDFMSRIASRNFRIFVPDQDRVKLFEDAGIKTEGTVDDLMGDSDVVVDATPEGMGRKNKQLYEKFHVKAVFQGGEEHNTAQASFNAYSNFDESWGKDFVRVVSCNTTGLARTLYPLASRIGIESVNAMLVRRGTDPNDHKKGPMNAIEPSLKIPSHHAPDLKTVLNIGDVNTVAMKVPTTLMHVHSVQAVLKKEVKAEDVLSAFSGYERILTVLGKDGVYSTAQIMEIAKERSLNRSDLYEIAVWKESVSVKGRVASYIQAVHQESDVIPENVDAIRSMFQLMERDKSVSTTDETLGIGKKVY
jgi:glyceraldehyde-3-phosphate dehydrogenase (NAD(P))